MRDTFLLLFIIVAISLQAQKTTQNCQNIVEIKVLNYNTKEGIPNALIELTSKDGNIENFTSQNDGSISISLPCADIDYTIRTAVENFSLGKAVIYTYSQIPKMHYVYLNLYPIKEFITSKNTKKLNVETIYFSPNKDNINNQATTVLDEVYTILEKYPSLKIEIAFHNDSRGEERDLINLTTKRAEACTSYLINKGIDSSRLLPKGYGATQLLNHCKKEVKCSEKEHLINKRSEFIVISQ